MRFSSPFTLSKTKEEVRDLLAEHGFFAGRTAFSQEQRGERAKFMGYGCEEDWADTAHIDTSRVATKIRNDKFGHQMSEIERKLKIWSRKNDKPRPAERSANSTHPADVFSTEPNVQNILDAKMGDTKHGGSPLWHTSYGSILDGSFWFFNKHHVENLPPAKQFWAPAWPTWNASLTHPKRVQVNKCQGMPSVTPNRLFPDEFKGVPCNPHLQPPEYDERFAWAHVSASGSVLFHQFHNHVRYNLYGRLGAPYGDQADLYKLAPNDTTHVDMHNWAAGGQPLGSTDLPLPVCTAWKLCFDDPLNPNLANATIKKYWDNYNFCRLEIVDLGDIQ